MTDANALPTGAVGAPPRFAACVLPSSTAVSSGVVMGVLLLVYSLGGFARRRQADS